MGQSSSWRRLAVFWDVACGVLQALSNGVEAGADSAAGWKALAELQYQNRQWQAAYQTCCKGLEWSARRRRAGHESLSGFALALRLCAARSLRRLGRLDEAEYAFRVLAGLEPPATQNLIGPLLEYHMLGNA